jgi:predicted N-formylglutamate amidohydrolase
MEKKKRTRVLNIHKPFDSSKIVDELVEAYKQKGEEGAEMHFKKYCDQNKGKLKSFQASMIIDRFRKAINYQSK